MRIFYTVLITSLLPAATLAATVATPRDFKGFVGIITNIIGTLIILVFALTFLAFMWGVVKGWIINGGDADGIESGKNVVMSGIIALVVMTSVWGILYLLQTSLFGRY